MTGLITSAAPGTGCHIAARQPNQTLVTRQPTATAVSAEPSSNGAVQPRPKASDKRTRMLLIPDLPSADYSDAGRVVVNGRGRNFAFPRHLVILVP